MTLIPRVVYRIGILNSDMDNDSFSVTDILKQIIGP